MGGDRPTGAGGTAPECDRGTTPPGVSMSITYYDTVRLAYLLQKQHAKQTILLLPSQRLGTLLYVYLFRVIRIG